MLTEQTGLVPERIFFCFRENVKCCRAPVKPLYVCMAASGADVCIEPGIFRLRCLMTAQLDIADCLRRDGPRTAIIER